MDITKIWIRCIMVGHIMNNPMLTFEERYETHESCQQLTLEFLYYYFNECYPNKEDVISCTSLYDTYKFLKKNRFNFICRCNMLFLLNPVMAYIFTKSIIQKKRFSHNTKMLLLHFSSAHELYNIDDVWNHYICEFKYNDEWLVYDSYYKNISDDYKNIDIKPIKHASIKKLKKFSFIIWR